MSVIAVPPVKRKVNADAQSPFRLCWRMALLMLRLAPSSDNRIAIFGTSFHNVIIGGVLFGVMAGYNYWFPKAFGFKLDERWGIASFWCWLVGFYIAFMPLYVLGLMGMTRRMQHYDNLVWQPWLLAAAVGVVIIMAGIACQIVQLVVSIRAREQLRAGGNPWNGRTLEWSTASPPPAWNFAVLPTIAEIDAYWSWKQRAKPARLDARTRDYTAIEMPKNTPTGFVTAFFAVVTGFALIWHIWWMAALGTIGAFATLLVFAFRDEEEIEIPAEQVARFDRAHQVEIAG